MLKLMKYEWKKGLFAKFELLVFTAVSEAAFLLGMLTGKGKLLGTGAMFLVLCGTMGIAYMGLSSILTLHRELNSKESYMLFLTPNSSFKILGAKVAENALTILVTGAFFLLLAGIDTAIATTYVNGLSGLMDIVSSMFQVQFNISVSRGFVVLNCLDVLVNWIGFIVIANLAVVLTATVLAGKKGSGIVAFVAFCALAWLQGLITRLVPDLANYNISLLIDILIVGVIADIMYYISAWIMERKLSV